MGVLVQDKGVGLSRGLRRIARLWIDVQVDRVHHLGVEGHVRSPIRNYNDHVSPIVQQVQQVGDERVKVVLLLKTERVLT